MWSTRHSGSRCSQTRTGVRQAYFQYLARQAVELSAKVFFTMRAAKAGGSASDTSDLADLIEDVSKKIDSLASDIAGQVGYQLEKQQLEMLSAQAKVVKLALDFGNEHLLVPRSQRSPNRSSSRACAWPKESSSGSARG